MGLKVWCSGSPHLRQRSSVYLLPLVWSLFFSQNLGLYNNLCPSSKQLDDPGVLSFPQGSSTFMCEAGSDWFRHLPLGLLGLRTVLKDDSGLSVFEAVYGSSLTIAGEFQDGRHLCRPVEACLLQGSHLCSPSSCSWMAGSPCFTFRHCSRSEFCEERRLFQASATCSCNPYQSL